MSVLHLTPCNRCAKWNMLTAMAGVKAKDDKTMIVCKSCALPDEETAELLLIEDTDAPH